MVDFGCDQAASLRRMLGHGGTNLVTVTAGSRGVGKTSAVINIAAALADRGSRVLVIDENYGHANVAGMLGIRARMDLNCVSHRKCTIEDALLRGPFGIAVLPAAGGAGALAGLRDVEREQLIAGFGRLNNRFDFVLIDAHGSDSRHPGMFSRLVQDTIVVCSATSPAITGAYALIKQLARDHDRPRFQLLFNRVASEQTGRVIFDNMCRVAARQLDAPLASLGCVPTDKSVSAATEMFQPVVEAFPQSPSAAVFRRVAASIVLPHAVRDRCGGLDSFMQRLLASSRFVLANAGA